jgi:resuscitation-promoting factor RpfB
MHSVIPINKTIGLSLLLPFIGFVLLSLLLPACSAPQVTQTAITVSLIADGAQKDIEVPAGTTAQVALEKAGIIPGNLDRSNPPFYTVLKDGSKVQLIRVTENFEITDVTIPFSQQFIHNESLPEGERMLIQPGTNGTQEITYRHVLEDGVEVSRVQFKSVVVNDSKPEIWMVGVQAPFAPQQINGALAYLIGGNAWVMLENTGKRHPLVSSGDLDGRVFTLSPDGAWLLYTRKPSEATKDVINSLWAIAVNTENAEPIDLKINNIIHFAAWVPNKLYQISFSTVEPRQTAPGWQANNNFSVMNFTPGGKPSPVDEIIEAGSGGVYGWWGTTYAWSPDGKQLAYARPDGVGLVDLENKQLNPLEEMVPLQTHRDWAWVPPVSWSKDGQTLYTVIHKPDPGETTPEESPLFDLAAILPGTGQMIDLSNEVGMFAYPVVASLNAHDLGYAFLQSLNRKQSETSRYLLMTADLDGSNPVRLFPDDGSQGIDPQQVVWSPPGGPSGFNNLIAVIYQGNIWLVDPLQKKNYQITGDGVTIRIDWR